MKEIRRTPIEELTDTLAEMTERAMVAEKAKEAAEKRKTYCRIELGDLLSDLYNFIEEYYPDLVADFADMPEDEVKELKNVLVQTILEALDKTVAQLKNPSKSFLDPMTLALLSQLGAEPMKPSAVSERPMPKAKSEDDILNNFLKSICH